MKKRKVKGEKKEKDRQREIEQKVKKVKKGKDKKWVKCERKRTRQRDDMKHQYAA